MKRRNVKSNVQPRVLEYMQMSLSSEALDKLMKTFENGTHQSKELKLVRPSLRSLDGKLVNLVTCIIRGGISLHTIRINLASLSEGMAKALSSWLSKPYSKYLKLEASARSEVVDCLFPEDVKLIKLKTLILSEMFIGPESRFLEYLSNGDCELETLEVSSNFKSDSAWERFCEILPTATHLENFKSSGNLKETPERGKQLGRAIKALTSMRSLDLGEEGVVGLDVLKSFTPETTITYLKLSRSCSKEKEMWKVAKEVLEINTNLQDIGVEYITAATGTPPEIWELLCRNRALNSDLLPMITTQINKAPFFVSHNKKIVIVGSGGKFLLKRLYYQFTMSRDGRKENLVHEFYLRRPYGIRVENKSSNNVEWRVEEDQVPRASDGSFLACGTEAEYAPGEELKLTEENVADILGRLQLRKIPDYEDGKSPTMSKLNCWLIPECFRGYGSMSGFCTPGAIYCVAIDAARVASNFREQMDSALSTIASIPKGSPIMVTTIYGRKDETNFEKRFNVDRLELMTYFSKELYSKITRKHDIITLVEKLKLAAINVPLFPLKNGQNDRFWRKLCMLISMPSSEYSDDGRMGTQPSLGNLRWYIALAEAKKQFQKEGFVSIDKFKALCESHHVSDSNEAIKYFQDVGEILVCAEDGENLADGNAFIVIDLEWMRKAVKTRFIDASEAGLFTVAPTLEEEEAFWESWKAILIRMNILVEVKKDGKQTQFLSTKCLADDNLSLISERKSMPFNLKIGPKRHFSGDWFSIFSAFFTKHLIESGFLEPEHLNRSRSVVRQEMGIWAAVFDRNTNEIFLGVKDDEVDKLEALVEHARAVATQVDSCFKDEHRSTTIVIPKVKNGFAVEKLPEREALRTFIEETEAAIEGNNLWRQTPKRDLFLSHNWGGLQLNHQRVVFICEILRFKGFSVWLDEEDMQNRIEESMQSGIENCHIFLAFLTKDYVSKALTKGDNCFKELTYATKHLSEKRDNLMFVGLEQNYLKLVTKKFKKKVGGEYYILDFSTTESLLHNIQEFTHRTRKILSSIDRNGGANPDALYKS